MHLRPRTIRTQLLALLLVPMVTLAALWTYSSYTTVRGAFALIRLTGTYHRYGTPVDELTMALQQERLAAVEYTASDGRTGSADFTRLSRVTDTRLGLLRDHARHRTSHTVLSTTQQQHFAELLTALDTLPRLRRQVSARTTNWSDILSGYSNLIDPGFRLRTSLTDLQSGEVAHRSSVVVELSRARELLSREDAMVTGGRLAGGMTDGQFRDFLGTVDGRRLLHHVYQAELPASEATRLDRFETGDIGSTLFTMEETARSSSPLTAAAGLPADEWRHTADAALDQLGTIDTDAARDVGRTAHDTGMSVLVRAAGVSLLGLLAVIASLLISLRISRRIATRLTALRDAAEELSGRRLPVLLRTLREGASLEEIAEAERTAVHGGGPALRLGNDEIGQVARAFGIAQRAAVQATVEQARLRRGVAAVFTTLARRSQVLLHRQLTLIDEMERRTEDPAELADLFRLDHMTTRMRRHAEGLLILSGNAPGRAWRRPVRLVEVVKAAVGEIEDYQRIVVRRMPRMALTGGAVADVLHLLAELLENACSFSPPDTQVVVDGSRSEAGFVIEVEDQGLGMGAERVAQANRELQDAARGADLPETDRLGLFTIGRLAARHGIRVVLRPAPGQGTVAVVHLPDDLLVPVADGTEHNTGPDDFRSTATARRERARRAAVRVGTGREPEAVAETASVGGAQGGPQAAAGVAEGAHASGTVGRASAVETPGTTGADTADGKRADTETATAAPTTAAGLPRRTRNSGLAPRRTRPETLEHSRTADDRRYHRDPGGRADATVGPDGHPDRSGEPAGPGRTPPGDRREDARARSTPGTTAPPEPARTPGPHHEPRHHAPPDTTDARHGTSATTDPDTAEESYRAQRERSPEAARSTMTAFARGIARGRSESAALTKSREEDGGTP
ncbi:MULTISPECIES: nitrate- and nitrite sensing domain-containing protein [Streptomycetaceae]|uniref:histidine kinase n=1 Tax=Streptantibioticus cattleyicolor (strain ATCC 35852 / DSM 46488 / JCM 4925 / NBRC 14057 / NRRL 8057) TaxID=1003195 RepID=F8JW73_STREN|nr:MULTISPECIES: nitrate- and nitrite sensing domain-containing protein [Streptomycetaceae]AEW93249.1 putative sensor-like histidine kinase [Streptantibioticus cattleyicolor NRRL 8057 = DSM 46488]MYS57970.1 histidine kinase [Streptomyces sp. SID5468]CCB73608.1 putative sensor-like histidine kinase [Streptantibioticus cattleyicolor NRRL 8057 = DSM 46488]